MASSSSITRKEFKLEIQQKIAGESDSAHLNRIIQVVGRAEESELDVKGILEEERCFENLRRPDFFFTLGGTLLCVAGEMGHRSVVDHVVEHLGVDVDAGGWIEEEGRTCLHQATSKGHIH